MKKNLSEEIIYRIILAVNETSQEHEDMWFRSQTAEDYAELNLTVTRYFDFTGEVKNADVVITKLIIWDDENNDIATESDYQEVVNALKATHWIDPAYQYEQSDNDRLFNLISSAAQPLNVAV